MFSSDDIDTIIEGAQSAAVDDSLWIPWAENIVRKVGSAGGMFGLVNQQEGTIERPHPFYEYVKGYEEYMGGMITHDPQISRCMTIRKTTTYTDDEHIDLTNPVVRDFMQWQSDRLRFHSHMTLVAKADDHHVFAFSLHFPKEIAERARMLKSSLQSCVGAISNAMRMGLAHGELLTRAYWDGTQALDDRRPSFLLSEHGRILHVNQAGEKLLADAAIIAARHRFLYSGQPHLNNKLQTLIAKAIDKLVPEGGVLRLDHGAPFARFCYAEIFPIHRRRRIMAVDEPAALLILHGFDDSQDAYDPSPNIASLLGLTAMEGRVAVYLAEGLHDQAIADRLHVALSTIRSHVRSIMGKTHMHSKAELAHFLTLLVRR